jgi:hypothetical protein
MTIHAEIFFAGQADLCFRTSDGRVTESRMKRPFVHDA